MHILGIETSCDETSVAVVEGKGDSVFLKANVVASSLSLHAKTGGVIPEVASRAQLKYMLPVLQEALEISGKTPIDAIAVTYGPGLIGSLLIGLETARALSFVWQKPLIPVNHMTGHVYANFVGEISNLKSQISNPVPGFPLIALVASGGHTDLLYMKKHGDIRVLGGTRDDAAGEAFDKIGRLLGLPYPGGAVIEQRARRGEAKRFRFPRPLWDRRTYDFSFSGLKTAVLREVMALNGIASSVASEQPPRNDRALDTQTVNDIAAGTQAAVVDVLVEKTLRAAEEYSVKSVILSGGVSSNQMLRETFQTEMQRKNMGAKLFFPPKNLCTDNAVMIASAAYFNYHPTDWREAQADPELYYE